MDTLLSKHWHHISTEEILDILDSDFQQGLDIFEVKHRQERFGLNVLTPKKGKPLIRSAIENNPHFACCQCRYRDSKRSY